MSSIDQVDSLPHRRLRLPASMISARAWRSEIAIGAGVLVLILVLGVLLPALTGYSPDEFAGLPFEAPSLEHPFGTDAFGRDVMVRSFAAARVDYLVAAIVVGISATLGTVLGVVAGSTRLRGLDWGLMRLVDAIMAFPLVVLVLVLVVVLGSDVKLPGTPDGLTPVFAAFLVVGWSYYARLSRSQTLSLRAREFVTAARLMGVPERRIILRHILPIAMATSAAYAVGDAVIAIALTASLSFLGAGVQPPTPEWGQMMFEGRDSIETAWWIVFFPALLLTISGLALAAIGDGLVSRLEGNE